MMDRLWRRTWARLAVGGFALLVVGCTTRTATVIGGSGQPGVAPALVVERFLRAVNANDLQTMARLFGTREGSVLDRDPPETIERRMFALASILRHDNYVLEGDGIVPGSLGGAVQIVVRMHIGAREVRVPFTVVRTDDRAWMVEKIEIERITAGTP